jgi:hypothetical protein
MWNGKPNGKASAPEGNDVANAEQKDGKGIRPFRSLQW